MVLVIQSIGLIVGLIFLYLVYINFKKGIFNRVDWSLWLIIWLGFMVGVSFPEIINGIIGSLSIVRALDFFTIFGFLVLFGIVFVLYIKVKQNNKKVEEFVRKEALRGLR